MERSIYKTNERNERFSGIATFECISCKTRINVGARERFPKCQRCKKPTEWVRLDDKSRQSPPPSSQK